MSVQQSRPFTLTVVVESVMAAPSGTLPTAVSGTAYSKSVIADASNPPSGGNQPYSVSAVTGLPPGLSIDVTGLITGTPTTPGTYVINGTISDTPE